MCKSNVITAPREASIQSLDLVMECSMALHNGPRRPPWLTPAPMALLVVGEILLDKEVVLDMPRGLIVLRSKGVGTGTRIHGLLLLDFSRKFGVTPLGWWWIPPMVGEAMRIHDSDLHQQKHPSEKQGW
ncbi:unnamed protein product [Linum trigynum]|uniref:Uncharacterized protein n=1 Tax=Linum trigynum TaxID=586398 RepID=A0AAV2F0Z1_9ROSI